MAAIIFHESYGEVTRPLLAAIRKYNVSPSDMDELREKYGDNPDNLKHGILNNLFQGQFSVFEMWRR